jgi:hypothetical protein
LTKLDTHKEDDTINNEVNDIRKIKRGKYREGDGIRTPNEDEIKNTDSNATRNILKEKILET